MKYLKSINEHGLFNKYYNMYREMVDEIMEYNSIDGKEIDDIVRDISDDSEIEYQCLEDFLFLPVSDKISTIEDILNDNGISKKIRESGYNKISIDRSMGIFSCDRDPETRGSRSSKYLSDLCKFFVLDENGENKFMENQLAFSLKVIQLRDLINPLKDSNIVRDVGNLSERIKNLHQGSITDYVSYEVEGKASVKMVIFIPIEIPSNMKKIN